jgi:hypothetical protein
MSALKTETRDVHDFNEVSLQGIGDLIIEQDPNGPESLTIEADPTVLGRLTSRVENGRLILAFDVAWYDWLGLGLEWLFTWDKTVRYHLKVRQLNRVNLSGAATLTADRLASDALNLILSGAGKMKIGELEAKDCRIDISGSGTIQVEKLQAAALSSAISGAGNIELAGAADALDVRLSGAGNLRATRLQSQTARVSVSGVGNADLAVAQSLNASLSGTGNIRYHGTPHVSQHMSGMGKISQAV